MPTVASLPRARPGSAVASAPVRGTLSALTVVVAIVTAAIAVIATVGPLGEWGVGSTLGPVAGPPTTAPDLQPADPMSSVAAASANSNAGVAGAPGTGGGAAPVSGAVRATLPWRGALLAVTGGPLLAGGDLVPRGWQGRAPPSDGRA